MRSPATFLSSVALALGAGGALATPPQANDDFYTLTDTTLTVEAPGLLANDVGGSGRLQVDSYFGADFGTVDVVFTDGAFHYTPEYRFDGVASFQYINIDETQALSIATVYIDGRPSLPHAADDSFITQAGVALDISAPGVLANDTGGIGRNIVAGFVPVTIGQLDFVVTDGSFHYTPSKGFVGMASFDYFAEDELGRRSQGTVSITVVPEPSTLLLLLAGAPLFALARRRRG